MIMFLHYQKKDRTRYLLAKISIFIGIVLMGMLAAHITKLSLPKIEQKFSWGIGIISVAVVIILAFFNRIKLLFRFKSLGFIVGFMILLLLSVAIETLVWSLGLISIPLLIDDVVVNGYFKYINATRYWTVYKDVIKSGREN